MPQAPNKTVGMGFPHVCLKSGGVGRGKKLEFNHDCGNGIPQASNKTVGIEFTPACLKSGFVIRMRGERLPQLQTRLLEVYSHRDV